MRVRRVLAVRENLRLLLLFLSRFVRTKSIISRGRVLRVSMAMRLSKLEEGYSMGSYLSVAIFWEGRPVGPGNFGFTVREIARNDGVLSNMTYSLIIEEESRNTGPAVGLVPRNGSRDEMWEQILC